MLHRVIDAQLSVRIHSLQDVESLLKTTELISAQICSYALCSLPDVQEFL